MKLWLYALATLLPPAPAVAEPLDTSNNRLYIPVTVNGQRTLALLDSAAEMTILDDDFAARLGLTLTGSAIARGSGANVMEARFADHVRIELPGIALDLRVAVLDLDEMAGRLLGRPVDMLLGRELFDTNQLSIDVRAAMIERGSGSPGGVRLPLGEHRGTPTIPAAIEGNEAVQAVFDLGNGNEVLIGRVYAERLGLTAPARIVERRGGGGLGGARDLDIVVLRRLTLAGQEFHDVRAAIDPGESASDLNIGTSILRHFFVTTDFPHRAIWLQYRPPDPALDEGPTTAPARLELIDGRLFIPVQVNDVATLALLDWIASEDVIDRDFARRLGVRDPAAPDQRQPGTIEEQMMRGLETHVSVDIGLFRFGHTMQHRELGTVGRDDPRRLDLALGRMVLGAFGFRIDIAGGSLASTRRWPARGVRLPITDVGGRPTFAVGIGTGPAAQAMLDTAHGPVRIARTFARRRGLAASAGAQGAQRVLLSELSLGGRSFPNVEAEIDSAGDAPDLAIGTSILRHFVITTSFYEGEIWLEPRE